MAETRRDSGILRSEQPNSPDPIVRTAQTDPERASAESSDATASSSTVSEKSDVSVSSSSVGETRKLMTVVFSHNRAAYYVAQIAGEKKMWLETARRPGDAPYLTPQAGFLGAVACTGGWRKAYDLNWSSLWAESRETRAEDDALVVDYAAAELVKAV